MKATPPTGGYFSPISALVTPHLGEASMHEQSHHWYAAHLPIMSKHSTTTKVNRSVAETIQSICDSGASINLKTTYRDTSSVKFKEAFSWGFTNPVTVTVEVKPIGDSASLVEFHAKNLGYGPIQRNHCQQIVDQIREGMSTFNPGGINTSFLR